MKELKHLNKYFFKYKYPLLTGLIITVLAQLLALQIPKIISSSLNIVEKYQLNEVSDLASVKKTLFYNILLIIGATLLSGFLTFLKRQKIIVTSRLIEFDMKNEIFNHYQKLSLNFYKNNRTGDLMNRISEDVSKVRIYFGPAIMYTINMIVLFFIGFIQMIQIAPKLTLYVFIPFPILSISIFLLSREINRKTKITQQYLSKLTTYSQEFFSAIDVVKSYSIEKIITKNFDTLANETKNKNLDLTTTQAFFFPLMILLIGISNILVIYIGGKQYIAGEIKIGVIASFIIYINLLTWPVTLIGWVTSMVQQAEASQKRINQFLKQTPEIQSKINSKQTEINGNIEFKNVSLTYKDSNITALKNINFSVKKGQTLAILGKTGSGKSSIVNLISRLYDCSDGTIFIDDIPIKDYNLNSIRNKIGFVPQEPFLFSDTIENNIKFGKEDATKDEIIEACKNTAIHNNIITFKNKYNTILGERGVTLSGGQKQRISIARAIIKNPKILIFDDCLSAVDTKTEEQILSNLHKISKDKTTFIISHRVSSVKNADKIIVLDKGKIIQQGTHNELLTVNGYYKYLYEQQLSKK
ncbi:MAG: ABC transporter ATP-binding protein [Tenacibaculum sp.]|nr:ABC transporter ATP-binding protein [Tenacibaculum sp.]